MRKRRLNFKARDYITGELKDVGYMEIRNAQEEPDEDPEEKKEPEETQEEEKDPEKTEDDPEEKPDAPMVFPPKQEETEEEPVNIYFYGDIAGAAWEKDGLEENKCPQDVQDFFNSIPEKAPVNVYMNSGGGDAYAGLAIANMIRRHKGKTTGHVDGLAASIASVIVSGCDDVIIHNGGQFMMHKPLTIAIGNANDFKESIKRLDACQDCITDVYMSKAKPGVTRDTITKLINAETWLGAASAQRYFNFKTDPTQAAVAAHSGYLESYKHKPKNLTGNAQESTQSIVEAVIAALDEREKQKQRDIQEALEGIEKYGAYYGA